jgi:hypothetical protein
MKKIIALVLLTLSISMASYAADGYKVKVNIANCDDTMIMLCHYFGNGKNVWKDDSCKIKPGNTTAVFKSTKAITGGIYVLLFSHRKAQVEMLLQNGDDFEFSFDRNKQVETAEFKNSETNTGFYKYQKYLNGLNTEFTQINADIAAAKTKADTNKAVEKQTKLSKEVNKYRLDFIKQYPSNLQSKIFNAIQEPEVPATPMLADGKTKDSTFPYRYYKGNYWSTFDFKDDRLVYTPIFEPKLEQYMSKLVVQTPDSFCKEADYLLKKIGEKQELFKYALWWMTRYAENSKVMGMDESFVCLVEKYYMTGKAYWLADSDLTKYKEQAWKIAPNTIGKLAPEIEIPDINEKPLSLRSIVGKADYTMVVFYDPTCGHCQKEIPKVDSVLKVMSKKLKVQVYGVENAYEDEKWKKFIVDKDLGKYWYHVHDPRNEGKFRSNYNVHSNPVFYLLDNNGIIVGKRFDHSNLEGLVEFLEKKKKNELK